MSRIVRRAAVPVALCAVSTLLTVATKAQPPAGAGDCANAVDYVDDTYGGRVRHLKKPDGHEHNIYYHRNPWNADNSYMVGVQSDLEQKNWRVVLYDGTGCLIRKLFDITQFDWRLVWDRKNPDILYTWDQRGSLYRYSVSRSQAELFKSFARTNLRLKPNGPSLNQAGDRILVATSDGAFRSYRLPDGGEERTFRPEYPAGCRTPWTDERYIGYRNYIVTLCRTISDSKAPVMLIYDDSGSLVSRLDSVGAGGHYDFSPDGRLAYLSLPLPGRPRWEIHVVDLSGSNDRVVYAASREEARLVQNMHLSWPDGVRDWFVASIFPSAKNVSGSYKFPLDEIVLIYASGRHRPLARTHTTIRTREEDFWAQPQASPSADGSRVSFNSNASGTIDQYVLWIPENPMN